ncbi:MAG: LD-carboxypeptidase [Dehalococcoidia bacterium]
MLPVVKPPRLRPGDTIGLVTPGRLAKFPRRIERGVEELPRLGFEVCVGAHALREEQTDEERAADINAMFADPAVRAIMLTLAGEASTIARLLDLLDYDLIRRNPKILVGQSAATTLILAVNQRTGLITFHGPGLIQHFGNVEGVDGTTATNLLDVLQGECVQYPQAVQHTDEFRDWDVEDVARSWQPCTPWRTLRDGVAAGRLLGGSLRGVNRNLASPYAVDFRDALLFWDLPFEPDALPDPDEATAALAKLRDAGVFESMAGMIASKPYLYDGHEGLPAFDDLICDALADFERPVLAGVDCGHTLPMLTLPVGGLAELDAGARTLRLLEPAVE